MQTLRTRKESSVWRMVIQSIFRIVRADPLLPHNRHILAPCMSFLAILLLGMPERCFSTAPQDSLQQQSVDSSYSQSSYGISVLRFTGAEMQTDYGYGWDFGGTALIWVGTHGGGMISLGGFGGSGSPDAVSAEWRVKSSKLEFWALRFSVAGLYRPTGSSPRTTVTPFVGAGIFVLGGAEKFSASVIHETPTLYEEVSGDAWAIRGSVGLFPVVGLSIPVTDRFAIQIIGMMLWGTGSGFTDLASEDATNILNEKIYPGVRRPDFRFTGPSVYVGISL